MIRKLWLERELRWIFPMLPLFLIGLTVEYTLIAQRGSIMAYHEGSSVGLWVMQPPLKQAEVENFLKEHPNGQIISLKDQPLSYFVGFDGMVRTFLPYMVVFLCAGGILCERSGGTASFILSLPVRRSSWLWSRAAALFVLTFVTALLACVAALILAWRMGIHQSLGWAVAEPLRLTLVASPWIGLSLLTQSLLAGHFDKSNEAGITAVILATLVFASNSILALVVPTDSEPFSFYIDFASHTAYAMSWLSVLIANAIGIAGLLLAVWRFERMDF